MGQPAERPWDLRHPVVSLPPVNLASRLIAIGVAYLQSSYVPGLFCI